MRLLVFTYNIETTPALQVRYNLLLIIHNMIICLCVFKPFSIIPKANLCNCRETDVHMITLIDLNVPLAKSKEKMEELCTLMQFVNDLNPTRHVGVVELPETAKKTSKRGLCDEEADLQQTLWGLRQVCDARWIVPFDIHPSADAQTARRSELLKPHCQSLHFTI